MFPGQNGPTRYETLEDTLTDASHSIKIPDALIGFVPGNAVMRGVHFKGCNIGQLQPYLLKFKEALGGNVKVTAPLFFHGITPAPSQGMYEYFGYEFIVRRKTAFADRKSAITEFGAKGFRLVNGSPVPSFEWPALIPNNIRTTNGRQIRTNLGVTIGQRTTLNTPRQFRVDTTPFVWPVGPFQNAAAVPRDPALQQQALRQSIENDPRFADTHPLPGYKRMGYDSFADFFAGYDWRCVPRGTFLHCTGHRFEYTVITAITDPATGVPNPTNDPDKGPLTTGNLTFNFYPNAGSPLPARTTTIPHNDPRFFLLV
jgi:hypothetical protein